MFKQTLMGVALCAVASSPALAAGKKGGAPNQGAPVGSVITSASLANAVTSNQLVGIATNRGTTTVTFVTFDGSGAQVNFTGAATLSGTVATITFTDGSTVRFDVNSLQFL